MQYLIENYGIKILELVSAILILTGFEFFNRKNIKGFHVMAVGQLLATVICVLASLWFLAFMHFINLLMQIRGYRKWIAERDAKTDISDL